MLISVIETFLWPSSFGLPRGWFSPLALSLPRRPIVWPVFGGGEVIVLIGQPPLAAFREW